MPIHTLRRLGGRLLLAALALLPGLLQADTWPSKPLRLVIAFPPGGASDVVGRFYAEQLSQALGQPVVPDNKPGAGTAIAAEFVARSAADGYTLSLAPAGQLTILPHLDQALRYDPVKDFEPVALVGAATYVLAASNELPVDSLAELIAHAKARPGEVTYASCGNGSLCHLSGELFKSLTGTDLLHVPYRGSAPATTALLGGEVDLSFDTVTSLAPQIRAGKLKGLAFIGAQRSPSLPEVPTAAEAGLPGYEASLWYGVTVPAGTPRPIIERLNRELVRIANLPETRAKLAEQGLEAQSSTPAQLAELIRSDSLKWGRVVAESGATID